MLLQPTPMILNQLLMLPDKIALNLLHSQPRKGYGTYSCCDQPKADRSKLILCTLPSPGPTLPRFSEQRWEIELSHAPLFPGVQQGLTRRATVAQLLPALGSLQGWWNRSTEGSLTRLLLQCQHVSQHTWGWELPVEDHWKRQLLWLCCYRRRMVLTSTELCVCQFSQTENLACMRFGQHIKYFFFRECDTSLFKKCCEFVPTNMLSLHGHQQNM